MKLIVWADVVVPKFTLSELHGALGLMLARGEITFTEARDRYRMAVIDRRGLKG